MKLFTGLEYLMIDIANSAGKDKLNFEDRLIWFKENIPESVITFNNKELLDFCMSIPEPDSLEQLYTGLLAYQDYWFKRPSGYRVSLDAICSGASLMSALTADTVGLNNTGLIGDTRPDLYTQVYKTFLSKYKKECDKTRADVKQAIMCFLYGSRKVPQEVFYTEEMFTCFYDALNQEANGAVQLQELLTNTWNSKADNHTWYMPDGFTTHIPVMVEKQFSYHYERDDESYDIPYIVKVRGNKKSSVSNCANLIHSIDGLLVREMTRRCMFELEVIQYALYSLHKANLELPDSKPILQSDMEKLGKLGELIYLYENSKFCTVRIAEYLTSQQSAQLLSQEHRTKLIDILTKMTKHGYIEVGAIHDSFYTSPNQMNYIRYWYKEMVADIVESNMLVFLYNQIMESEQIEDPISKLYRKQIANQVRESSYGLS